MDNVLLLKKLLEKYPDWNQLLFDSIVEAKKIALAAGMEAAKKWPDTLDQYFEFLYKSARLIPCQDYPRATFDVLATFYWLLDQAPGQKLQQSDEFNGWMHAFADDWGAFLATPESAKHLDTFEADPAYNAWQYVKPPHGWRSFNDFFARYVKPGLRPVAGIQCDGIVTSPADSVFKSKGEIDHDNRITFKHTHTYSILDLLEDSPYRDHFADGLYMHSFLGPADYHHFHAPTRGTVLECRAITGRVFLQVTIDENGEFQAPDDADNGYEFKQERGLIIFDSPVGLVAVLPIGMAQVSSVNMTAEVGAYLRKGDPFGYFMFGGSDIILLFQKDSGIEVTAAPGIHTNVGMCIAQALG